MNRDNALVWLGVLVLCGLWTWFLVSILPGWLFAA